MAFSNYKSISAVINCNRTFLHVIASETKCSEAIEKSLNKKEQVHAIDSSFLLAMISKSYDRAFNLAT
jgi:hypothetical protein